MKEETNQLLKDRGEHYGHTWLLAGQVMGILKEPFVHMLEVSPQYVHNWVLILSKLIRVLFDPYHKDSWRDIIGYATLVLNHLENPNYKGEQDGSSIQSK